MGATSSPGALEPLYTAFTRAKDGPLTIQPGGRTSELLFNRVEAMGIEPTNLLHAMQALYQLSYAPRRRGPA